MKEFIISALPFLIIGICLAIICANFKKSKVNEEKTYQTEGMCFGMCLGVALSTSLNFDMGLGISFGMLVGETIGILVKKK